MRPLAAPTGGSTSGRAIASRQGVLSIAMLIVVAVAALAWQRSAVDAPAAASPVTSEPQLAAPAQRSAAAPEQSMIRAHAERPMAPSFTVPGGTAAPRLRATFEQAPDLHALSLALAPAVAAGQPDALWTSSLIHDYCAGFAASPADYARDTALLVQMAGAGTTMHEARSRVARRCGRFAPVDVLTPASILRLREEAALSGHLAAEASLLAMDAPLDDSPAYRRDLVERVQASADPEAYSALAPAMGVAASGQRAYSGLVAGTPFAELAWQLAACRQGLDCSAGSALMTRYCANGGICARDGGQDFRSFVYDAAIPRQGAEQVEGMVETLLQGVSGRVER